MSRHRLSPFGEWAAENIKPIGRFDDTYHERLQASQAAWDACGRRAGTFITVLALVFMVLYLVTLVFLTKGVCK